MSYSRWGSRSSGYWYTYWYVHPVEKLETRDNALFDICGVCMFTAKELRNDIETCLNIVAKKDSSADKDKLDELRIYISEFLEDVNREYPNEQQNSADTKSRGGLTQFGK